MHLSEYTENRPYGTIQNLINDVVKQSKDKWGLEFQGEYPTSGIGITTLRPFHVENTTTNLPNNAQNAWRIDLTTANTWQDWINVSLNENLYVLMIGFFNTTVSPSVSELAFKANGIDLPVQNIEQIYSFEEPKAYMSKPFSVAPENNFTARLYPTVGQNDEQFGAIGYTVGKRLVLIQES